MIVPSKGLTQTQVIYTLSSAGTMTIRVYDSLGALRKTLYSGFAPSGVGSIPYDGTDATGSPLPSGTYFVVIQAPGCNMKTGLGIVR